MTDSDGTNNCRTNMTHPRLDAENILTLFTPVARNPDRCEVWVGTTGDNLDLGEVTSEDAHPPRSSEDGDEDDTVLSYAVI